MTNVTNRGRGRYQPRNNFRNFNRGRGGMPKRNFYIPNPRTGYNQRIYFPRQNVPRRRRQYYRNTVRIMYGQQQDLAFGNQQNLKGMGPTFTTPVSESKIINSYFKFANDQITFCQPVNPYCYNLNTVAIPLHPMFYTGRISQVASQFLNFMVTKAVVHSVPLIGSTSTGMIAIGSTRNCAPLTQVTGSQFTAVTSIGAEMNPVWMCTKYIVPDIDNGLKTMGIINRKDIPNNIYVIGSGLAGAMNVSVTLFLEMTIKLSRPAPYAEYGYSGTITVTLSGAGVRSSAIVAGDVVGFVIASTVSTIDVGEYIKCPGFVAATTDYDINVTHNEQVTNYLDPIDQGALTIVYFVNY